MLKLKFDDGKEYSFSQSQIIIGRIDSCDLIIAHESISRNHAKIIKDSQGHYCLGDLGSANGTYINNEELPSENFYRIENGDKLGFGDIDIEAILLPQTTSNLPTFEQSDSYSQELPNQAPIFVDELFSINDIGQNNSANIPSSESDKYLNQNENYSSGQNLSQNINVQTGNYDNQALFGYDQSTDIPTLPIDNSIHSDLSAEIPNLDELQEKLNSLKQKTQASSAAAPLGLNLFSGLKNKNEKPQNKVKKDLSEEEFLQQMGFASPSSSEALTNSALGTISEKFHSINPLDNLFGKSNQKLQANKGKSNSLPEEMNEEDLLKQFESFSPKKGLSEVFPELNAKESNSQRLNSNAPNSNSLLSTSSNLPDTKIAQSAESQSIESQAQFTMLQPSNIQQVKDVMSSAKNSPNSLNNNNNASLEGTLSQETLQELASKLKSGIHSSGEVDRQGNALGKISQALKSTLFGKN